MDFLAARVGDTRYKQVGTQVGAASAHRPQQGLHCVPRCVLLRVANKQELHGTWVLQAQLGFPVGLRVCAASLDRHHDCHSWQNSRQSSQQTAGFSLSCWECYSWLGGLADGGGLLAGE